MPTAQYGVTLQVGTVTTQKSIIVTGDHENSFVITLPAGKAVTAWVKTDANTAACNLPSGHGYSNGKFDVYWATGVRYGVDGTITVNALALDGGAGDDFPASGELNMVVCKQVTISGSIDGDLVQIIGITAEYANQNSTARAHLDMQDGAAASIEALTLTANTPQVWHVAAGATNVFTGNVIEAMYASNGSATEAAILKIPNLETATA